MKLRTHALAIAFALQLTLTAVAWGPGTPTGRMIAPFRTLIVGGGPDLEHNQAAIESNVRYVERLLPSEAAVRVLFTDGNSNSKNVLCEDANEKTYYRAPQIARIDGPSDLDHVTAELTAITNDVAARPSLPVLLYFTGHGSPSRSRYDPSYDNNRYDLWGHDELSVRTLAGALKGFPKQTPITLVMVECFSGAFGNLLFEGGSPGRDLADLHICGFFASVAQREAAGCTPEINEANYRDFTSYFFAALSGVDRLGKPVTGADYNHDGKVGMDEAFAYALIHDDSIDTPVCTSDVFLRHFVTTPDQEVVATPFSRIRSWAGPAQRAALDALAASIDFNGEDRLARAYEKFTTMNADTMDLKDVHLIRFIRLSKSIVLAHMLRTSPDAALKARFAELLKEESANPIR